MDFNKTLSFIVEYQLMGQRPWSWSSETWSLLRNHEFAMLNTEVSLIVVPDFTICVYGSSCKYLCFWSCSLFFSFSIYFVSSHPSLGMIITRKRMQMSEKKAEQGIITWTAVHRYSKIFWIKAFLLLYFYNYA